MFFYFRATINYNNPKFWSRYFEGNRTRYQKNVSSCSTHGKPLKLMGCCWVMFSSSWAIWMRNGIWQCFIDISSNYLIVFYIKIKATFLEKCWKINFSQKRLNDFFQIYRCVKLSYNPSPTNWHNFPPQKIRHRISPINKRL